MEQPAKDSQNKILLAAIVFVAAIAAAVLFQPRVREALAPELKTAWVGIEVEGSGVAEIGPLEIEAGRRFTLHAVLEGVERNGESVYYTLAPALRFSGDTASGGQPVAADRLRRWDRSRRIIIRWFTVEGVPPYVELTGKKDLEGWGFQELYRSDWPLTWSIPGDVNPSNDSLGNVAKKFGTLRYQVSFELYGLGEEILPGERIRSWGAGDVRSHPDRFPTVYALLPGRLAPASRVFGLSQLVPLSGSPPEIGQEVAGLAAKRLAYSRTTVIRDQLRAAGKRFEDLVWTRADLVEETSRWGGAQGDAYPGDLVRVGERMVVLYEDRGKPGALDYDDLCFDYALGTAVRRLGDVFTGDGVVELASLGPQG